ncbi:TonB-dependent siderophore receptor [Steroidobacter flavus]|uniref:TonB-dependent siderophore receptor n=1 Tax=Steroidobacter flavus TaxID=1842136 RepID=A0ABV8SNJ0_9GAMM
MMHRVDETTSCRRSQRLSALVAGCVYTLGGAFWSPPGLAQQRDAESAGDSQVFSLSIPAQALGAALLQLADATGTQIVFETTKVRGLKSAPLSGKFPREEALRVLLSGTGFTYRFSSPTTVTLVLAPADQATRTLGPVRVEGMNSLATAGINGSTDPTATEGTGSYTSSALTIGSKAPLSIRETPQSVSVVTQQRMQDQNLTDFTSTLNQSTGVTLVQGASSLETNFYSRGFQITRFQIDGGAPLSTASSSGSSHGFFPLLDMAQYDHIELLRGADGLFNGYGNPGGAVNLVRKRPLDHRQVVVEGAIGSWSNRRSVIDAAAPLGFDGRLRGRTVLSYQDRDYFYDTANDNHTLSYGILEADVTPATVIGAGVSMTRMNALPWASGLPRYGNGDDLKLPRDTCLCTDWSRWNFETTEVFAQAEQEIGDDWNLKFNVTRLEQQSRLKVGTVNGAVLPDSGTGPTLAGSINDYSTLQHVADVTLRGAFPLFGERQQLVAGVNYQNVDAGGYQGYGALFSLPYPPADVFNFDPSAYPEPANSTPDYVSPKRRQIQWGGYANLQLTFWSRWHMPLGVRWSRYEYESLDQGLTPEGAISYSIPTHYTSEDLSALPYLSLSYDLLENWTAYASYTSIYNSQADYLDKQRQPLDPMTGSNWEAGLKGELFDRRLSFSVAAYRIEQKNFPIRDRSVPYSSNDTGITCCFYTAGNSYVKLSQGADLEVTGALLPNWQLSVGYTYNVNEYKGENSGENEDKPLSSYTPKHLLKLWTSYRPLAAGWNRFDFGLGVNAQTDSYNTGSTCLEYRFHPEIGEYCASSMPYDYTQGAYAVFSARAGYRVDERWTAALNVGNLGDRTYYQTPGHSQFGNWYGEPRSYMVTLRGTF